MGRKKEGWARSGRVWGEKKLFFALFLSRAFSETPGYWTGHCPLSPLISMNLQIWFWFSLILNIFFGEEKKKGIVDDSMNTFRISFPVCRPNKCMRDRDLLHARKEQVQLVWSCDSAGLIYRLWCGSLSGRRTLTEQSTTVNYFFCCKFRLNKVGLTL